MSEITDELRAMAAEHGYKVDLKDCEVFTAAADRIIELEGRLQALMEQDEVHWKTRRSLLKDVAHEQDMASQADVACTRIAAERDAALSRLDQCSKLASEWRKLSAEDCVLADEHHGPVIQRAMRDC